MVENNQTSIPTSLAVRHLAEVLADLIQHQQETAKVVQALTDKVAKLEEKKND